MSNYEGGSVELRIKSTADAAAQAMSRLLGVVRSVQSSISSFDSTLDHTSRSVSRLATGLRTIERLNMGQVNAQIDAATASLDRMSARLATIDTTGFSSIVSALHKMQDLKVDENVVGGIKIQLDALAPTLTQFLQQLQGINISGLQPFIAALKEMPKAMEAMQALDVSKIGQVFSVLTTQIQPFLAQLKAAGAELQAFANIIATLGKPGQSAGINNLSNSLTGIVPKSSSASTAIRKLITWVRELGNHSARTSSSFGSMLSIGKIYFLLNYTKRLAQGFGRMATSAINFIEVENLFSRSLGSARNEALQFQNTLSEAFGLALPGLMKAQGIFNNMLLALGGINEEVASILSADLTKMAIDFSALYNVSIDSAIEKFEAAIAGQTKPIRSVSGMDITQATLQTYLDAAGINRTVRSLTQMEKRLLIIHALQEQLARSGAIGAWAQEIENPANQLKILSEQIQEVGRWLSAVFVGTLGHILPYINGFVMALKEIIKAFALLVGYRLPETDVSEAMKTGDAEEDIDGIVGGLKDIKNAATGIDELNIVSPAEGGGGAAVGGVDPAILGLLSEYDNLMEGVRMKAHDIRDALLEWLGFIKLINAETGEIKWHFVDLPDETYFYNLGAKLANLVNEGLAGIDWASIRATVKSIAENIAAFLNGAVAELDWAVVGNAVGNGINAGLLFVYTWLTSFDFSAWGRAIATGLDGLIDAINWPLLGRTFASHFMAMFNTVYNFITTFDWSGFGTDVGDSINAFFASIDPSRIGETFSKGFTGAINLLRSVIARIDWAQIGTDIKIAITSIDWADILSGAIGAIKDVLVGVRELLTGILGEGTTAALTTLAVAIGAVVLALKGLAVITTVQTALSKLSGVLTKLSPALTVSAAGLAKIGAGAATALAGLLMVIKSVTDLIKNWDKMDRKSKIINAALAVLGAAFITLGYAIATGLSAATLGIGALIAAATAAVVAVIGFISKLASEESVIKSTAQAAEDLAEAHREVEAATQEVADAQEALKRANENVTTSQENLRIAEDAVTAAKERLLFATENLVNMNDDYINAVDRAEKAADKLREAEERLSISGKDLAEQVAKGILDYKDMNDAQREVYKAYVDNEGAQHNLNNTMTDYEVIQANITTAEKDLATAINGVATATDAAKRANDDLVEAQKALKTSEDVLRDKIVKRSDAHWANELALAAEKKNYGEYRDAVVDAFKKGELSAAEAQKLISQAMVGMSKDASDTFTKDIPDAIKEGLDPAQYETAGQAISRWFKNLWESIANLFNTTLERGINLPSQDALSTLVSGIIAPKYATGGFPEDGFFFANHNELIGSVAGRTAVANNDQVTTALAQALEPVLARFVTAQNPRQDDRPIVVTIDGREVVRAVRTNETAMGSNPIGGAFANA